MLVPAGIKFCFNLLVLLFYFQGKGDTHKEIQPPAEDKVGKQEIEIKAVSAKKAVVRQESDLSVDRNVPPTGKK